MAAFVYETYHNREDDTHRKYCVSFEGECIKTLVTHNAAKVDAWFKKTNVINKHKIYGVDFELCPEPSPVGLDIATMQFYAGKRCLIFQILYSQCCPTLLKKVLTNEDYTLVGIDMLGFVAKLPLYNLCAAKALDLSALALYRVTETWKKKKKRQLVLSELSQKVTTWKLIRQQLKPYGQHDVGLGDWDVPWLSKEQVGYAATNASTAYKIGQLLEAHKYDGT